MDYAFPSFDQVRLERQRRGVFRARPPGGRSSIVDRDGANPVVRSLTRIGVGRELCRPYLTSTGALPDVGPHAVLHFGHPTAASTPTLLKKRPTERRDDPVHDASSHRLVSENPAATIWPICLDDIRRRLAGDGNNDLVEICSAPNLEGAPLSGALQEYGLRPHDQRSQARSIAKGLWYRRIMSSATPRRIFDDDHQRTPKPSSL